jgi:hypothetical protein
VADYLVWPCTATQEVHHWSMAAVPKVFAAEVALATSRSQRSSAAASTTCTLLAAEGSSLEAS